MSFLSFSCPVPETTFPPIDFSLVYYCISQQAGTGRISIGPTQVNPSGWITGGSGVYEINRYPYTTLQDSANGEFAQKTGQQFDEMDNGVWFFSVRDKNNPSNITTKSIQVTCPS